MLMLKKTLKKILCLHGRVQTKKLFNMIVRKNVEMDTKGSLVKLLVFFLLDVHAQKGFHALIWCSANLS
jgi:hypothetical protein